MTKLLYIPTGEYLNFYIDYDTGSKKTIEVEHSIYGNIMCAIDSLRVRYTKIDLLTIMENKINPPLLLEELEIV